MMPGPGGERFGNRDRASIIFLLGELQAEGAEGVCRGVRLSVPEEDGECRRTFGVCLAGPWQGSRRRPFRVHTRERSFTRNIDQRNQDERK